MLSIRNNPTRKHSVLDNLSFKKLALQNSAANRIAKSCMILIACLSIAACGGNKKNVSMKLHSNPLGAYALMQVTNKGNENPDWVFLGPTPIVMDKKVEIRKSSTVSIKMIRPGFFEQTKSWKGKDFLKEQKRNDQIIWVPSLVKQ